MLFSPAKPRSLLLLIAALAGCGGGPDPANPNPLCQPIAVGKGTGGCFLPFPSSFYLSSDAQSRTGHRVAIPQGVLPKNQAGSDFDAGRLNLLDGWSPATQLVADLGARVDPTKLIGQEDDWSKSLLPSSSVQLLEYDTGARVPLFAEVDQNVADKPDEDQVLLIHPALRLRPNARYVVALQGLTDTQGAAISIAPFQALVTGNHPGSSRLQSVQSRYDEIFALLEKQGVPRAGLTLAWDFVTASDEQGNGNLLQMRDAALKRWEHDGLGATVTATPADPNDPNLFRTVDGTFDVPSFLTDNVDTVAGLKLDANGLAVDTGTNYKAKLALMIPKCALTATAPLPIIIFGHGLLGSARDIYNDTHKAVIQRFCMIEMATSWVGLSDIDVDAVVPQVFGSFDKFWLISDRLQQAQVDQLILARFAARKMKALPELTREGGANGTPLIDGSRIYYLGGSEGGILGNAFFSLSPEIARAAMNVGGGFYSLALDRSADFHPFKLVMDMTYPSQVDQQILIALSQSFWDFAEAPSYIEHILNNRFPDPDTGMPLPQKHIVFQESHHDAQVPNLCTRAVARTMGLPLLSPAIEPVFGITQMSAPLDSAYTQWDVQPMMIPPDNDVPPAQDNGAHSALGKLRAVQDQLQAFFSPDGQVTETCTGRCVFPGGN